MPQTLLRTKLYVPPLRPNLVPRARLLEQLNQGLDLGHKLTLISAPAGFGKTTLASEWAAGCKRPAAWLSLDEGDNDPTRFLTYLVAALRTITPDIGEEALAALQSPQPAPGESTLTALLNDITAVADPFVLVLDDYHVIDAQAVDVSTSVDGVSTSVDGALTFLLDHLPPQMHLVITTRDDPQLPLARLRARGQLTEQRAEDLRFTFSEAAEFLNQVMGLDLSAEEIAALENRTEGWITGLQLAAISMRGRDDAAGFIKSFTGSHHFVLDYLVEEVLEQQSASVHSFLLHTSLLDQLSGSLCNALSGENNGQQTLEFLEQANLFMIPLDNERRWYRYHHLFADLLKHRLRQTYPERIPELHRRASVWYELEERPSDAIRHALAGEDFERAAALAELAFPSMSGSYQSIAWLGWLKALPDEVVRNRPVLCASYAWAFLNAGNLEAAEARMRDAERWLEPGAESGERLEDSAAKMVVVDEEQFRSLAVSLAAAHAYHAQALGDVPGTKKYARQVLDLIPEGTLQWRTDITALLGLAQWASGEVEAAHQTFTEGLAGMSALDMLVGTFVIADLEITLGRLQEALSTCEQALQLATEYGEPIGTEDVYTEISKLHRERGDLEAAALALLTAKKLGEQVELPDWQHRWCIAQARLCESLGELDNALDLLDEAQRTYVRTPLPVVRPIAALKARIWVAQGRLAEALNWSRERNLSVDDDLSYLREVEHTILARVLIAQYKNDRSDSSIHEALGLLERLLQAAEDGGRVGSVIETLMLQALAHHAQGDILRALAPLERALILSEAQGYVRIFVDEGPPMAQLLSEAAARGILPDYTAKLLAVLSPGGPEQVDPAKTHSAIQIPNSEFIEPLSEREIEVLGLIAEGLTNKEIAARLYISLNTVKVHTRNINSKLGVNSRMQAAVKARALGILPST